MDMNIGLYGHSMAQWTTKQPFSFGTKLVDHFNADIVNSGCAQGSEERILFELKKTKKLDLAIIFHSNPDFFFVPSYNRDYTTLDRDSLVHKIPDKSIKKWFSMHGYEQCPEDLLEFWYKVPNWACYEIMKQFEFVNNFEIGFEKNSTITQQMLSDWSNKQDATTIKQLIKEKNEFAEDVNFYIELFDTMELHKKYLYHHDLQMNRYHGALIQIDQYLKFKKIPVVHCLGPKFWYPNWFTFESGVIDSEIYKLQHEISGHYAQFADSENNMTETGNQIAFDLMIPLIYQALEKVK
jgi:hypothetical protein